MKITTEKGRRDAATLGDVDAELDRLEAPTDPDAFLVVERPDGAFLQVHGAMLERGGFGDVFRARLPEATRRAFRDFVAGREDWDRGIVWSRPMRAKRHASLRDPETLSAGWLRAKWFSAGMAFALFLMEAFGRFR